jgi:hypothetical protein
MSFDDQDLGVVILELTVDSFDDGRRFEVEYEIEPARGAWPEPEQPRPCECRTPAAVRLIIRMPCEHLPCGRDSIALSARGQGIVGGFILTDRDGPTYYRQQLRAVDLWHK